MPDPLSRALADAVLAWGPGAPAIVRDAISLVAQFGIYLAVLLVVVGAWLAGSRTIEGFVMAILPGLIAAAIAIVVVRIAGGLFPVPRPFVATGLVPFFAHAADPSLPSDHVTVGMAMLGARIEDRRIRWAVAVIVLLVGLARVLAGVHWLDDIVLGALLGLACAWLGRLAWIAIVGRRRAGLAG
ncbi:MAG: phosphatase PAP2 family protein [Chloroflexota bacterium]|nr:MAG: phosphatase PAP2 family protein [Chloroflexota bacterium]